MARKPAAADAAKAKTEDLDAVETMAAEIADEIDAIEAGKTISVRSVSKHGRRRAGRAFGPEPVEVALAELSPRELDAILTDPALVVTGIED